MSFQLNNNEEYYPDLLCDNTNNWSIDLDESIFDQIYNNFDLHIPLVRHEQEQINPSPLLIMKSTHSEPLLLANEIDSYNLLNNDDPCVMLAPDLPTVTSAIGNNLPLTHSMTNISDNFSHISSVQSTSNIQCNVADNMSLYNCRPYPPVSVDGIIDEHDRPYSQYGHLDNDTIAQRCHFDLIGKKTKQRRSSKNNRLSRQMYAIACQSETNIENIMKEILRQFPMESLQYVCVSTDISEISVKRPHIYIQIILKKVVNKIGWFLDEITDTQCNYHVTDNDLAWNEFSKKNRLFFEFGQFRSKRVRTQADLWTSSPFVRDRHNRQIFHQYE